jgi:hypothetical protein
MSKRVRALMASLLALATLIPLFGVANAQELPAQPAPYPAENQMCITGTIINFDETLVTTDTYPAPLLVTATPADPNAARVEVLTEDGTFEFEGLTPGVWTISLTLPPNWESVPPYGTDFQVTVGYGMHECVEVRFKIRRPVIVEVLKIDDAHTPLSGWIIRAAPAYGNWFASPVEVTTGDDGRAEFRLTEGKWVFTEKAPSGQVFSPVMPSSGKQEVDVKWDPAWGDTAGKIQIRFKNRLTFHGCIVVTKTDVPVREDETAFGLPGWKMTVKRLNGTVVATGHTDAQGYVRFPNLPYGPYIVTEESKLGWEPTAASSYSVVVSRPQTTAPDDAGCEQVNFINRQVPPGFCIEGYKIDANGHIGIPGWTITATPVYKGSFPNPDVDVDPNTGQSLEKLEVKTDGTGKYVIDMQAFGADVNDYRLPGAAYRVCEEKRDGWLPHTALCQTVYLPRKPGACVKAWNFVNQQVGHSESVAHGRSSSSSGAGCRSTHTVVAGESLFGIGSAYGVSGSAMLSANPWIYNRPNHYVYVGDHVCIP